MCAIYLTGSTNPHADARGDVAQNGTSAHQSLGLGHARKAAKAQERKVRSIGV